MNKKMTKEDKLDSMKIMYKSFSVEQVEHLDRIESVDARYKCAQRYLREINEGKKGERAKALEYFKRYGEILEGLECIDDGLWTDEKKITAFGRLLDAYCDKCVKLVEENNRKHLERLKHQRDQHRKEFEAQQAKYEKEISELEKKLG
jgi:predicted ribosome quality control (RQC) complex YloA/Tae2 family protein